MVVDPLSALGLAGNVLQFVDFCGNVISESRKTYQSATEASPENIELESIAGDVRKLCKRFQHPNGGGAISVIADKELANMIVSCNEVAAHLQRAIEQLKVRKGPHRKWRTFRQALITVWNKDKLSGLQRRLSSLREQVTLHLVADLSNQQHSLLKNVNNLREESESMNVDRDQKLDAINSAMESLQFSQRSMPTKDDLNHIHQTLQDSSSATTDISKELEILRSLRYKSMEVRHSNIAEAYRKTFDWIFHTDTLPLHDSRAKIGFDEWLRSKSAIFWISGKAGSGKSTLMKYICDDARTTANLRRWAGDSDLVTANFYFWNAGTDMQKSQQGLLQSLLYEILSKCPDLLSTVCQQRWDTKGASSVIRLSGPWRLTELSKAFERLQSLASTNRKFCFFIDGLDEYDGDHFELIDIMLNIAKSPHIKLCLSSRPWNCFEDAFGKHNDRKLYLQDLTREDIEIYVKSKLTMPVTWASAQKDSVQHQELALEIVERAQGVFLWVYLVVGSLQEGFANRDSIVMLQKKLRALPTDLELFFEHILNSVDSVYQEKLSGMFQVALEANAPRSLMTYSFLDEEDPDFAIRLAPTTMTLLEVQSRQDDMRRRINGRSKGLLEISTIPHEDFFYRYNVEFLHRTVRDFLRTPNMRSRLRHMTSSTYSACFALSRAFLAEYKTVPEDVGIEFRTGVLNDVLEFARGAEEERKVADIVMLDELQRTGQVRFHAFLERESSFLERAISWGLIHYVDFKLNQQPQLLRSSGGFLLSAALQKRYFYDYDEPNPAPMIQLLLKRGISPNQPIDGSTVWREFLKSYPRNYDKLEEYSYWRNILRLLLLRGADVQATVALIDLMLYQNDFGRSDQTSPDKMASTIELLLSHGLDPNQPVPGGYTIWTSFLQHVYRYFDEDTLRGVITAFLRYGANTLDFYISDCSEPQKSISAYDALKLFTIPSIKKEDERKAMKALIESETAYQRSRAQFYGKTTNTIPINLSGEAQSPGMAPRQTSFKGNRAARGARSYPRASQFEGAGRGWSRNRVTTAATEILALECTGSTTQRTPGNMLGTRHLILESNVSLSSLQRIS